MTMCMTWVAQDLVHPPTAPLSPCTHSSWLDLKFTSDTGVGRAMERQHKKPVTRPAQSHCHLFASLLPTFPTSALWIVCKQAQALSHVSQNTPVSSKCDPNDITAPKTEFLRLWVRLLTMLGSGPRPGFCPYLLSSIPDEALTACGNPW